MTKSLVSLLIELPPIYSIIQIRQIYYAKLTMQHQLFVIEVLVRIRTKETVKIEKVFIELFKISYSTKLYTKQLLKCIISFGML